MDAETMDLDEAQKHTKIEKSSPETSEGLREPRSRPGDLFESHRETAVVLLPVQPYLVHVYWEVTPVELKKAIVQLGEEYARSRAILRCHDVTNIVFDGTNAHGSFDVPVDLSAKGRYVDLWSPEKSYFVELGFETEGGRFFPIARSNVSETPSAWPAPQTDAEYMLVEGDYDLVETVPAPVEVQASQKARPLPAHPSEHEPPSAVEANRRFEMWRPSVDSRDSARARVYEELFGDDRTEAERVSTTAEVGKAEPGPELLGPTEKTSKKKGRPSHKIAKGYCAPDLTEVSERRFTSGFSSK